MIELNGHDTLVLVEQTSAVDPRRPGEWAGRLSYHELSAFEAARRLVLGLHR